MRPSNTVPPRVIAVPGLIALTLCCTGCGVGDRVAQCNELARAVNSGLGPVREYIEANPAVGGYDAQPEQYLELETRYVAAAKALKDAQLADGKLAELKADFVTLFEQTGASCRDLTIARKDGDAAAKARARRELTRLGRREDSLHSRARGYCTSP